MRLVTKLVQIKNIKKGETFSSENLWVRRPSGGDFNSSELTSLFGKRALVDIEANVQIKKEMIAND